MPPAWVSKGSCRDLSRLADNAITATSQAAGNMMSSNATAMTAPGSQPVSPLPPAADQDTPNLTMTSQLEPGHSGKEDPRPGDWNPPAPAWRSPAAAEPEYTDPPADPVVEGHASQASVGVAGPARGANAGGRGGRAVTGAGVTTVNAIAGGGPNN
jgi:hypothetical protein